MRHSRLLSIPFLVLALASPAAAQDQKVIVDQPLQLCPGFDSSRLDEARAEQLVKAALGLSDKENVDSATYYIIHATSFVKPRMTPDGKSLAENAEQRMVIDSEHWYVFHKPWTQRQGWWWFRDSRQAERFKEQRIMASSKVAMVYLYVNVPTVQPRTAIDEVKAFYLAQHTRALKEKQIEERDIPGMIQRVKNDLPAAAEMRAKNANPMQELVALEAERYFQALVQDNKTIVEEFQLVDNETGAALTGITADLATTQAFKSLAGLFYRIEVTKKIPAPLQNLKDAASLAFGGQSDVANRAGITVTRTSSLCAGRAFSVDHLPSDMQVKALTGDTERSKQLFDNEGRYWWDVSFALPLDLRRDLTIDVDAGQVAAKSVEKADLFAVVNLGLPRDTKKLQWQLIPTFIYGIPITGKPLKHHLVGFTIGLNYVQLMGGMRFDRVEQVATVDADGTPVGVEGAPPEDKWKGTWVWGVNLPVGVVTKIFKK